MRELLQLMVLEATFQLSPWACDVLPVACSCRELFLWVRHPRKGRALRWCVFNLRGGE